MIDGIRFTSFGAGLLPAIGSSMKTRFVASRGGARMIGFSGTARPGTPGRLAIAGLLRQVIKASADTAIKMADGEKVLRARHDAPRHGDAAIRGTHRNDRLSKIDEPCGRSRKMM